MQEVVKEQIAFLIENIFPNWFTKAFKKALPKPQTSIGYLN